MGDSLVSQVQITGGRLTPERPYDILKIRHPCTSTGTRGVLSFLKSEALHPADFTIREDGVVTLNPELARQVAGVAASFLILTASLCCPPPVCARTTGNMPSSIKVVKVFIGSPGGLDTERQAAQRIVSEVNRSHSEHWGCQLKLVGWEETLPGYRRAQSLINQDLDKCEYFVGVL